MSALDIPVSHEHDESPEQLTARQLVGVWLFIAGDAIILASLLFTFLYLRGLNTANQWIPRGVHEASALMAWLTVVVVAGSAFALWSGEKAAVRGASAAPGATWGAVLSLVGAGLAGLAIADIPHKMSAVSGVRQVAGSYASSLLAIDVSNLVHLLLLAFLGFAVATRARKGLISAATPGHARLVRIFFVWVAVSVGLAALISTVFVASPK